MCRGSEQGWRAGAGAWVWSPLPPDPKGPGERLGKRSPPRPGALSCSFRGRPGFRGGVTPSR